MRSCTRPDQQRTRLTAPHCAPPAPPSSFAPPREDAQVLFARLLSGYGRDASLNAKERKAPGSVAVVQLPGSPAMGCCCSEEDDTGTPYSRRSDRSNSEPGDVELIERQAAGGEFMANGGAGGYGSDKVRRRNKGGGGGGADAAAAALHNASAAAIAAAGALGSMAGGVADAAMGWLATPAPGAGASAVAGDPLRGRLGGLGIAPQNGGSSIGAGGRGGAGRDAAQAVVGQTWHQLSHATTSLVEKIKRAASQPALGAGGARGGGGGAFGDAADVVLMQTRRPASVAPAGGGGGGLNHGGGGSGVDLLSRGLPAAALKKSAKDD
jgi:hypothetical protein